MNSSVEVDLDFDGIMGKIWDATEVGMEAACLVVEGQAYRLAPKDTGRLSQSITHRVNRGPVMVEGEVGTNVEYAAAQEFGVPGRNRPQPYMGPALTQNRPNIIRLITDAIRRAL